MLVTELKASYYVYIHGSWCRTFLTLTYTLTCNKTDFLLFTVGTSSHTHRTTQTMISQTHTCIRAKNDFHQQRLTLLGMLQTLLVIFVILYFLFIIELYNCVSKLTNNISTIPLVKLLTALQKLLMAFLKLPTLLHMAVFGLGGFPYTCCSCLLVELWWVWLCWCIAPASLLFL